MLTAKADIDAAKAKLKVAQSDVAQAETMLTYTALTAPFDGFVTSRNVDAGHYVQPAGASNAKPIMTVAKRQQGACLCKRPETEAAWVVAGFGKADAGDVVTILFALAPHRENRGASHLEQVCNSILRADRFQRRSTLITTAQIASRSIRHTKMLLEQRQDVLSLPTGAIVKALTARSAAS